MFFKYNLIFTALLFILNANLVFAESAEKNQFLKIDRVITLNDAIDIALSNNPGLLMKKSEVRKAGLEIKEISAMRLPSISSTYYWTTGNSSNILSSPQGVAPQSTMLVPSKSFNDLNITMMLPIYTGGILSAKERQAKFMEMSEKEMLKEKENETIFQTTELYYRALYMGEYLKVIDDWFTLVNAQLTRTKYLLETGKVPKADLLRDESELAVVLQNKRESLTAKENAILDLKAYLGISIDSNLSLKSEFNSSIPTGKTTKGDAINSALKNRPELLAIQNRINAAKANKKAAKGAYLPQVSLMGMYDIFQNTEMMGDNGFTVGLVTSIPVYDGNIRSVKVKQSETEIDKVLAEEKEIRLRIENEVRQAILQLETANQNVSTTEAALKSAREYLRITELRHEAGKSIKIEVYDSILTKVRAELNHLRALYDFNIAGAKLNLTTGSSYNAK